MSRISLLDKRTSSGAEPEYVRLIVINKTPLMRRLSTPGVRGSAVGELGCVTVGGRAVERPSTGQVSSRSFVCSDDQDQSSGQWRLCPVNRCEQKRAYAPGISALGEVCPVNRYSAAAVCAGVTWMVNPGCATAAGNDHRPMYVRNIVSRHEFIMWRGSADQVEAREIWKAKCCRKPTTSEPSDVRLSCNESPCRLKFRGDDRKLVWDQRMTRRPVTKNMTVEPRLVPVTSRRIAYVEGHVV